MAPISLMKGKRKRQQVEESESEGSSDSESSGSSSSSEGEENVQQPSTSAAVAPLAAFRQKVLVLSSRGVTQRMRHVMNDLSALLPQAKKDAKLDSKHQLYMVNELAELSNCNNALFFEARRHQDLYMWASKTPNGPSVRFHVLNSHTMDELKMTGNCLKGSRPIVCFDKAFDEEPHLRVIKELLMHIFAVPKTARRAKPFVDHVVSFSMADGKVWFRNYQIIDNAHGVEVDDMEIEEAAAKASKKSKSKTDTTNARVTLSEIGPRFVLVPVKIFEGSFGGATLYENKDFTPPSEALIARKMERAGKYKNRKEAQDSRANKLETLDANKVLDPLGGVFA